MRGYWRAVVSASLAFLLLLGIAAGLGSGQVQTGSEETGPGLTHWEWANWVDMPELVQEAWVHYLSWTTDRVAWVEADSISAQIFTEPPEGIQRVESLFALLLNVGNITTWQEEIQRSFLDCLAEDAGVCTQWQGKLATAVDYSPFHVSFLQITYYDIDGKYCGLLAWKESTGEVRAHGCVPFLVEGGDI